MSEKTSDEERLAYLDRAFEGLSKEEIEEFFFRTKKYAWIARKPLAGTYVQKLFQYCLQEWLPTPTATWREIRGTHCREQECRLTLTTPDGGLCVSASFIIANIAREQAAKKLLAQLVPPKRKRRL